MRVALLDDDRHMLESAGSALREAGFTCHAYRLSKDLLFDLKRESFDLLMVDWLMPDVPGIDVVRAIRAQSGHTLPVLFVTSRDAERDVIEALEAGADDYMVKPVRTGELIARVKALLRRSLPQPEADRVFELDPFRLDLRTQEVWRASQPIELTQKEFQLALLFLRNVGKPLSRGHIREVVWGRGSEVPSRTMDTHVSRVRTKMELRPEQGFLLAPVYSYGYRLEQLNSPGGANKPS
jgi:DNA-binding response OmpR family regulator